MALLSTSKKPCVSVHALELAGAMATAEELRTEAGRSMDTVAQKPCCKLDVSATLQADMEPSL